MMRTVVSSAIAVVVLTAVFGFAYPLVMTGFAQVAFQDKANGSLITVTGRSSAPGSSRRTSRARGTSTVVRLQPRLRTTRATTFANLARPTPRPVTNVQQAALRAILEARAPVHPGPHDRGRHSCRRRDDVGVGHRPAHLVGLREPACAGSPPSAGCRSDRSRSSSATHRRPHARVPRRARSQRPRTEPRTRQPEHSSLMARQPPASSRATSSSPRSATRSPSSTRVSSGGTR